MKIFSIKDYFYIFISSRMIEYPEEYRLTKKELDFLVDCCVLNSRGMDLGDFDALWDYFGPLNMFARRNDLSTYKKKLGEKRWIKGKRNVFKLPEVLDIIDNGDHFLIMSNGSRIRKDELSFSNEYKLQATDRSEN